MRLAHLSDLHFFVKPSLGASIGKRTLGLANLYLRGRIHQFSGAVAEEAIARIAGLAPDLVLMTGDVTALASPAEFEVAREAFKPLTSRFPTLFIPGNHDVYTLPAHRSGRMDRWFGAWMATPTELASLVSRAESAGAAGRSAPVPAPSSDAHRVQYPTLHLVGEVAVLGLNPCRFHLGSSGRLDPAELFRLEVLLQLPEVLRRFRVLMLHYPLLNQLGQASQNYWRRLENRERLMEILRQYPVELVLHGHDHLRYLNHLMRADGGVTYLYNAGSAAFSRGFSYPIPASFNLYTVEGQRLVQVEHYDRRPEGFVTTYVGPPLRERWSVADSGGYG